MCRDYRFSVMQARLSRQQFGFQPSCAQNRLAQNQNCIRLGLGRFLEVPLNQLRLAKAASENLVALQSLKSIFAGLLIEFGS